MPDIPTFFAGRDDDNDDVQKVYANFDIHGSEME
jgi:hypothetical protein